MHIKGNAAQQGSCKEKGLSVLELLVIFAALAVVILITVPGSTFLLEKYRVRATYAHLLDGLELAKAEAELRSSSAVVCPSSNGKTCRTDGNWNQGWLVFSDGNGNGTAQEIELIRAYAAPNPNIQISAKGAVRSKATFTLTGLVEVDGAQTGQFKICHRGSDSPPRVVIVQEDGWVELVPVHSEVCEKG
jgi:type IV fimbrial biogenesis protein FimT